MSPGPQKRFDREDVLERATMLLWRKGYDATGLSELLEHVGIGRQSMYDTFGDKRKLFLEVLDHYHRTRMATVMTQLRAPGSVMENLVAVVRHWEAMAKESGGCGCLVGNATAEQGLVDPEITDRIVGYYSALEDVFEEAFARGQEQGEIIDAVPSRDLARVFLNTMQGTALLSRVMRDPDRARSAIKSALAMVAAH